MLGWAWRRRRPILWAATAGACGYVGYYLWQRQREIRFIYREVTRALEAAKPPNRLRVHFAQTQRNADVVALEKLAAVRDRLRALHDSEPIRKELRSCASGGRKVALWNDLTVVAVARAAAAVYALVIVVLLTRVTMNLVARHLLLDQCPADDAHAGDAPGTRGSEGEGCARPPTVPQDLQRRVLSITDHFTKGPALVLLAEAVYAEACDSARTLPLDASWTARALCAGPLARVREGLEAPGGKLAAVCASLVPGASDLAAPVPPSPAPPPGAHPPLPSKAELLDEELGAIFRSAPFAVVFRQALDGAFEELERHLASRAGGGGGGECALALARHVPRLDAACGAVLAGGSGAAAAGADGTAGANEFMRAVVAAQGLEELCLMVYAPHALDAAYAT